MKCANHPEVESVAFCGQCGKAVCAPCRREVLGMIYCEACVASRMKTYGIPSAVGSAVFGPGQSPIVALALGFIPGVGAIYNGQVVKGMVQVLIFGSLIAVADRVGGPMDTIFGLGAAAFYFYMVIDSYQTARRRLLGEPQEEWFGLGDMKMNAPVGAVLLIGLGVLFLLDNLGLPVFHEFSRFWPVLLIVVGVVLLQRRMGGGGTPPPAGPGSATGPKAL